MNTNNNPWIVQAPSKGYEALPVGAYVGKFTGTVEHPLQGGELRWKWRWEVTAGEHKGKEANCLTECKVNELIKSGRLIAGMLGRPLVVGEDPKAALDACMGQTYMVSVAPGPKGGKPCVQMVAQMPTM